MSVLNLPTLPQRKSEGSKRQVRRRNRRFLAHDKRYGCFFAIKWLFLRHQEELTTQEQETVERLRQLHPEIDLAYLLVQQFLQMVRTRLDLPHP